MSLPEPEQSLWSSVDRALESWLAPEDSALRHTSDMAARAGLPEIAVLERETLVPRYEPSP